MPWLKTVVKHEALAVRRQRERAAPVTDDGELSEPPAPAPTHDQAERYERLRHGAEALRRLKPQEVRCLLLRAQGYSYDQICEQTGYSYTKVNRCFSEGRRAFLERVAGIETGAECERLEPLLSALADGEAGAEELASLRPHLKSCLSCRARLREYRRPRAGWRRWCRRRSWRRASGDGPGGAAQPGGVGDRRHPRQGRRLRRARPCGRRACDRPEAGRRGRIRRRDRRRRRRRGAPGERTRRAPGQAGGSRQAGNREAPGRDGRRSAGHRAHPAAHLGAASRAPAAARPGERVRARPGAARACKPIANGRYGRERVRARWRFRRRRRWWRVRPLAARSPPAQHWALRQSVEQAGVSF